MSLRPRPAAMYVGVAAATVLALGGQARAEPAPPFSELLRQAYAAPRVAESAAEVRQAEGLAQQAGVRPNPTASLEVENFTGSGRYAGLGLTETTLSAGQTLELGGKRPARIAAGRAQVETARARLSQARAQFAYELAVAYTEAEAAQLRQALTEQGLALAQEDARVAQALVAAGKEAALRALQAQSAISAARANVDAARAQRAAAFSQLTALAAAPAPLTTIANGLLAHADRQETFAEPDPSSSPGYLVAQAAREAAARRVRVEQTRAVPDVTASLGVRHIAEAGDVAVVAGLSAPIPLFDRNRGNISAARAELQAAEARVDAARLEAEADIRSALAQANAATSRVAATHEAEQTAQEAYRLTRIGYEAGKLPLIELLNARRALGEALANSIDARLGRLSAEARLARLQGRAPFGDQP